MTIKIKADTNDGDYITQEVDITEAQLKLIEPVIKAIKKFKPYKGEWMPGQFITHTHNFPTKDCLREDMGEKSIEELYPNLKGLELFEDISPYSEYGIHTIESIEIVETKKKLL